MDTAEQWEPDDARVSRPVLGERGSETPRATRLVVRIDGQKCWLWRAVDQEEYVLDEIVQTRRNTKAAKRLLTRLLKKQGMPPKRMITDKLRSYGAATRQVMPNVEHRSHKGLNNRAENSHLPLRKREQTRQGFRSVGSLQDFVSIFSAVRNSIDARQWPRGKPRVPGLPEKRRLGLT